jgi:beta-lactam-binding protein with PASTA domain
VVSAGARPADATSVMPPAEGGPVWSGRAGVRPPQPGNTQYQQVTDWPVEPGPQRNDRWWMPIVVGIVVLVLLAALGWGIYLIVQNAGKNDAPAPAATTSAPAVPPTVATTAQTTVPTTEPTTTEPTTQATTTDPTDDAVAIPALKGLSVADAKAALQRVGINSTHVIYQPSDAEPDTVIDSDPEEGQEVPPDTRVTLIVSAPSTATTTPTATDTTGGN